MSGRDQLNKSTTKQVNITFKCTSGLTSQWGFELRPIYQFLQRRLQTFHEEFLRNEISDYLLEFDPRVLEEGVRRMIVVVCSDLRLVVLL